MLLLENWHHLQPFGIDMLTAESCGFIYRVLCDVTARGKRIIEKCLDCELFLHENWNQGRKSNDPNIGSIMLAPQMFSPVAAFALLDGGYSEVWILKTGSVLGLAPDEDPDRVLAWKSNYDGQVDHVLRNTASPRNEHQMTGRTT